MEQAEGGPAGEGRRLTERSGCAEVEPRRQTPGAAERTIRRGYGSARGGSAIHWGMKRYRLLKFDFDSRAMILATETRDDWEPEVKRQHEGNKERILRAIAGEFGSYDHQRKVRDLLAIGSLPLSVLSFHNKFHSQARTAFVAGAYYPALTGVCALGERVLNHLLLGLRDSFRATPQFKAVCRQDAFDDWDRAIETLEAWDVLLPVAAVAFRNLKTLRHQSIHFRPAADVDDRALALAAIEQFANIVRGQFSAFGSQPWFIPHTPGAAFLKHEWENRPFIRLVYRPNCVLVGPRHCLRVEGGAWHVDDEHPYQDRDVSDEEFAELFAAGQATGDA